MSAEQLHLFASLDFPGRSVVLVREMAERLGVSIRHLLNEIDSGALVALDLKSATSSRRAARIPIECYRDYVVKHLTSPSVEIRARFIANLPAAVRSDVVVECFRHLGPGDRRALMGRLRSLEGRA